MRLSYACVSCILSGIILATSNLLFSQVAINTDGSAADPSAMLDVKSTVKGLLIPRMTASERTAIPSPATSLLVFDTDANTFWFYNGNEWEQLVSSSILPSPVIITPPLLTATANDYNPANFSTATEIRISGDNGLQAITGFNAGTSGEEKTITNAGDFPFYLAPEHSGSTAANRIAYFEEVMLPPGGSCKIYYDSVSSRWRPVNSPCPNYTNLRRSIHYDKSAGKPPQSLSDDIHLGAYGNIDLDAASPTSASPFCAWDFNTGSSSSGGMGLYFARTTQEMAWVSGAHMVTRMYIKTPSALSDNTNNYYIFLRLADSPADGSWDQNNSLGIRYRHTASNGNWECYSRSNNTDTVLDSGVPLEVNTEYELMVTLNKSNTEATYFINGVMVGRITSNLPAATSLGASNHLEKVSGSSARSMLVYRFMAAAVTP